MARNMNCAAIVMNVMQAGNLKTMREHKQMRDFAPNAPAGWRRLLLDCHRELREIDAAYEALAVRERFGILTIIIESSMPIAQQAIDEITARYEDYALSVCQFCSAPGEHSGWSEEVPQVRCRDCAKKMANERS